MQFERDHIMQIITGKKTQTRRVCKPGEALARDIATKNGYAAGVYLPSKNSNAPRLKWIVGNDYAVTPGQGLPGVWWHKMLNGSCEWLPHRPGEFNNWKPLRIRLLDIRRERLQDISLHDAMGEGYPCHWPPDPMVEYVPELQPDPITWYRETWISINTRQGTRWDDNPYVWALSFEVAK